MPTHTVRSSASAGRPRAGVQDPLHQDGLQQRVAAAKLDDVNFHTLRHTFASWAVMRGVSLKELQELLGHASLTMTMRYAHLAPERLRTAVTRLEGLTSQPASDSAQASAQAPIEPVEASQKSS